VLKLGTVALDGTKLHANASRHSALSYVAHTLPSGNRVAGKCLDQEGEGQAAGHVGIEIGLGGPQRAKATGGAGLGGGHHGGGDGADFHADTAGKI